MSKASSSSNSTGNRKRTHSVAAAAQSAASGASQHSQQPRPQSLALGSVSAGFGLASSSPVSASSASSSSASAASAEGSRPRKRARYWQPQLDRETGLPQIDDDGVTHLVLAWLESRYPRSHAQLRIESHAQLQKSAVPRPQNPACLTALLRDYLRLRRKEETRERFVSEGCGALGSEETTSSVSNRVSSDSRGAIRSEDVVPNLVRGAAAARDHRETAPTRSGYSCRRIRRIMHSLLDLVHDYEVVRDCPHLTDDEDEDALEMEPGDVVHNGHHHGSTAHPGVSGMMFQNSPPPQRAHYTRHPPQQLMGNAFAAGHHASSTRGIHRGHHEEDGDGEGSQDEDEEDAEDGHDDDNDPFAELLQSGFAEQLSQLINTSLAAGSSSLLTTPTVSSAVSGSRSSPSPSSAASAAASLRITPSPPQDQESDAAASSAAPIGVGSPVKSSAARASSGSLPTLTTKSGSSSGTPSGGQAGAMNAGNGSAASGGGGKGVAASSGLIDAIVDQVAADENTLRMLVRALPLQLSERAVPASFSAANPAQAAQQKPSQGAAAKNAAPQPQAQAQLQSQSQPQQQQKTFAPSQPQQQSRRQQPPAPEKQK